MPSNCHLLPLAMRTSSGVEVGKWVCRTVHVRAKIADLDGQFHDYLRGVQRQWPNVLPPSVSVEGEYSLRRSPRRGSTTQARNQKILL